MATGRADHFPATPTTAAERGSTRLGRGKLWAARLLTAVPVLALLMSAAMKLARPPQVLDVFVAHLGYPQHLLPVLAALEIACVLLYAIPRTAVLGAVLITGYLGGAVATHMRVGDPFAIPLVLGVIAWAGLYLRDDRLRTLLPMRRER